MSRWVSGAVLGAAIAFGAWPAAASAAAPPSLAGEAFSASMSVDNASGDPFPFILGQCGNAVPTPTFDFYGQASGPYPGSFEERGSVTYSSTATSDNMWGQGPVLTFNSTFTITEADGVTVSAVGTANLGHNVGDLAVCGGGAGGGGVNIGPFLTHYTATITNPDGTTSQDSGSSYLTLSQDVGLGEFWNASLIQSFFATTPPPPPTLTLSNLTATVSGSTVRVSVDTSPAIVNVTLDEGGAKIAPDTSPVNGVASWTVSDLAPGRHTLAVQGWDSPSGQPGDHSGVQTFIVTVPTPVTPPSPSPSPTPTPAPPTPTPAPTPHKAVGSLSAYVQADFTSTATYTEVGALFARKVPAGATVWITCTGRGCPFATKRLIATHRGTINLDSAFRHRRLHLGDHVTVTISHARESKRYIYVIRARRVVERVRRYRAIP